MNTVDETTRKELEDFRAANDRMYNNAGEWTYESTNVGLAVFSHDVAKLDAPTRANKLIVTSTISPSAIVVLPSSSSSRINYHQAYKKARAKSEAEAKRQKRVGKYKSYAMESRMRASVNNGLRWFKNLVC